MLITQLCGSINNEVWPNVDQLELFKKIELPKDSKRRVKERLKPYVQSASGLNLLDRLLTLNPAKRITADEALDHGFFWEDPMPNKDAFAKMLSSLPSSNFEFLSNRRSHQGHPHHHKQSSQAAASGAPTQQKPGQQFDRVF